MYRKSFAVWERSNTRINVLLVLLFTYNDLEIYYDGFICINDYSVNIPIGDYMVYLSRAIHSLRMKGEKESFLRRHLLWYHEKNWEMQNKFVQWQDKKTALHVIYYLWESSEASLAWCDYLWEFGNTGT